MGEVGTGPSVLGIWRLRTGPRGPGVSAEANNNINNSNDLQIFDHRSLIHAIWHLSKPYLARPVVP